MPRPRQQAKAKTKAPPSLGNFGASIEGLDAVRAKLGSLAGIFEWQLGNSLLAEGREILDAAKAAVPIDSGELRDSGSVSLLETNGSVLSVTVSFGEGRSAAYAAAVHETPSAYDPPSWKATAPHFSQGGPKYLERPLLAASNGMAERIAAKILPK